MHSDGSNKTKKEKGKEVEQAKKRNRTRLVKMRAYGTVVNYIAYISFRYDSFVRSLLNVVAFTTTTIVTTFVLFRYINTFYQLSINTSN